MIDNETDWIDAFCKCGHADVDHDESGECWYCGCWSFEEDPHA